MNSTFIKWITGISVPFVFGAAVWAVDARIEQKTTHQIQQLRMDIVNDFEQNRIDYLRMKQRADIIDSDEVIELKYLEDKQDRGSSEP